MDTVQSSGVCIGVNAALLLLAAHAPHGYGLCLASHQSGRQLAMQ